ncbi:MAG: hypothetical protein ACI9F9_002496, partial [Candidatus Paceibacteria bacterium]
MSQLSSVLVLLLGLSACSEAPQRNLETRVLCVWDSWDGDLSAATPHLNAWNEEGHLLFTPKCPTPSMSSALASFLTGMSVGGHGLRSIHELGSETLSPEVSTRAELFPDGARTLGSVSRAHFSLLGLNRGVDEWRAPEISQGASPRTAEEVWAVIEGSLETALAADEPVLLVLHFSDLAGDNWRDATPTQQQLEAGLAPWRGKGG